MGMTIISFVVSGIALLISYMTYTRSTPNPIVGSFNADLIPNHGLFSYNKNRIGRTFFFWDSGILVRLQIINPSSSPVTMFDLTMSSNFDSNQVLHLLTKQNAVDAVNDKIYAALNDDEIRNTKMLPIFMPDSGSIEIPAYSCKNIDLFFLLDKKIIKNNPSEKFALEWKYAMKRNFFRNSDNKLKSELIKIDGTNVNSDSQITLHPDKILKKPILDQITS